MRNLIFISDLHIGDGNSKDDFEQDDLFESMLLDWNNLENPEIVIVGDGFEILESSAVQSLGLIGFWESMDKIDENVIEDIERRHPKIFKALQNFKGNIWYVVGNHDYYILKNQRLQQALKERISNLNIVPYFYDEETNILAIHGNQFDSVNKFKEVNGEIIPPLGDFIARYMMSNFDNELRKHLPDEVIRDYDNVRPTLDVFLWLEKITEVYENSVDLLKMWIDNFIEMMRQDEAKTWMKKNYPFMSKLSIVFLNKVGGIKLGELIVRMVMNFRKLKKTDYLKKAAVRIFKDPSFLINNMDGYVDDKSNLKLIGNIDGIITGHSHRPNFEVLKVKDDIKFYMNCGSWKPVVERRSSGIFQRYFEIFYGIAKVDKRDLEIVTGTINKLKKREVID
ncbi:metallophosphoesterase [Fervidobacterium sp. 2310opik-2]|uniref:metallophosphoesterase n=1 Tax=Fervidobacterium sp. 2310opik-2 TaxID=1755815 RepID=UPI0013DEEB1D|nr:metallophosphoesterase [Fervidobacterium sp. 2310opik-2]KAF2960895.1 UDP-2,3-diacylglucosamine hydrolase [Fervidobacterium sp. 2310opik-2]